jgi:hypothetical protein
LFPAISLGLAADGLSPAAGLPNYNLVTVSNGATNVRIGSANPADMNVFATTPAAAATLNACGLAA